MLVRKSEGNKDYEEDELVNWKIILKYVRFQIVAGVIMKTTVYWNVTRVGLLIDNSVWKDPTSSVFRIETFCKFRLNFFCTILQVWQTFHGLMWRMLNLMYLSLWFKGKIPKQICLGNMSHRHAIRTKKIASKAGCNKTVVSYTNGLL